MNNWRYFYISGQELRDDGEGPKHVAAYPLSQLLSMSLEFAPAASAPAASAPAADGPATGAGATVHELRLMFSMETVTVRGKDLQELWEQLQQARVDPAGSNEIPIPGSAEAVVEFSQSDP